MTSTEMKVATVEAESTDNMATLPVSRAHNDTDAEKNNAIRDMDLKHVQPKPDKRYTINYLNNTFISKFLYQFLSVIYFITHFHIITYNLALF